MISSKHRSWSSMAYMSIRGIGGSLVLKQYSPAPSLHPSTASPGQLNFLFVLVFVVVAEHEMQMLVASLSHVLEVFIKYHTVILLHPMAAILLLLVSFSFTHGRQHQRLSSTLSLALQRILHEGATTICSISEQRLIHSPL